MSSSISQISNFYAGKNIFCTGATGFMGKVLVEKLLRDCEDLAKIYILIRNKKGKSSQDRYEDYINHFIFDKIRQNNPNQLSKIVVIKGDVTIDNLDLSSNDENELIENVNLIFHCAANVRFDLSLRDAVNFNLNGTHRVLKLAEKLKNLLVFVHVSTAYCHCKEEILDEKYYEAKENPYLVMDMVRMLSDQFINEFTPKILDGLPNTYAYTKGITEDLVHSYRKKIPIAIARPSIVVASWKEPIPGFIEGVNGPTGLMIGAAKGVIRSMHCNPDYPSESIPVDININCFIAMAAKRAQMEGDEVFYCNITDSGANPLTWGASLEMGKKLFYEYPMSISLWYPAGSMKKNYYAHMFCVIFFHYLPAYVIDFLLFVSGNQPFLVNVQKRVSQGLKVLQYYTTREWIFKNENFKKLYEDMSEVDKDKFYCDLTKVNFEEYILSYILGTRQFIIKEKPESLPSARARLKRLYYLDKLVSFLFYAFLFYFIYTNLNPIVEYFERFFAKSVHVNLVNEKN